MSEEEQPEVVGETPEVGGEAGEGGMSKNAMKKAAKAAEAAAKKAAKEAERAAKEAEKESKPSQPKLGGDDGEDLDPTQYFENRMKAVTALEVCMLNKNNIDNYYYPITQSLTIDIVLPLTYLIASEWQCVSSQVRH